MTRRERDRTKRAELAEQRHRKLSLYHSNLHVFLPARAARRLADKLAHICIDCPAVSLVDNVRCARCRDRNRRSTRVAWHRRARQERRLDARYRAIDEIIDLTRVRVLRAARRLDWFTCAELNESLGNVEYTQRNTTTVMLGRLVKAGCLERRAGDPDGTRNGSSFEYRITTSGIEELGSILSGARIVAGGWSRARAA